MITNKYFRVVLGIVLLVFISIACVDSSIEPPNEGVFLQKGGNLFNWSTSLVELVEFKGVPGSDEMERIPYADTSRPVIMISYPEVNLEVLGLVDMEGNQVSYDLTQQEEFLEIQPTDPLMDLETYCLVKGDPTSSDSAISHWCFTIFLLK